MFPVIPSVFLGPPRITRSAFVSAVLLTVINQAFLLSLPYSEREQTLIALPYLPGIQVAWRFMLLTTVGRKPGNMFPSEGQYTEMGAGHRIIRIKTLTSLFFFFFKSLPRILLVLWGSEMENVWPPWGQKAECRVQVSWGLSASFFICLRCFCLPLHRGGKVCVGVWEGRLGGGRRLSSQAQGMQHCHLAQLPGQCGLDFTFVISAIGELACLYNGLIKPSRIIVKIKWNN